MEHTSESGNEVSKIDDWNAHVDAASAIGIQKNLSVNTSLDFLRVVLCRSLRGET